MELGNLQDKIYILIPFAILVIIIYGVNKKNKILKLLKIKRMKSLEIIKGISLVLGAILVVIALLSPEKTVENKKVETEDTDIYIIFDISNSMLAEDVAPNRMESGKKVVKNILDNLIGDRVGIIPFSDTAYIQMPLTDDYEIARIYLNTLDTSLISGGGTELLSALKIANKSFEESQSFDKNVIIVSDGGEKSDEIKDYIEKNKMNVYSVAIGTDEGSLLPLIVDGIKEGFIKNKDGEIVISKLNRDLLQDIGIAGYYEVNNIHDKTSEILKDIEKLKRTRVQEKLRRTSEKYFQYPLFLALLFILLGYFLRGGTKNEK